MPRLRVRADAREEILNAADRLLGRFGYSKTTMDDLAREAGIGKGTTYLHFRGKDEVFLSLIDRSVDGVLRRLRAMAGGPGPPEDRLRAMLCARVLLRFDAFQGYAQGLHDLLATLRPLLVAQRERHLREEAAIFAAVLREEGLPEEAAGRLARALLTGTNSLLPYYLSPAQMGGREAVAALAADVAELLLAGLPSPAPSRPPR